MGEKRGINTVENSNIGMVYLCHFGSRDRNDYYNNILLFVPQFPVARNARNYFSSVFIRLVIF